MKHDWDASSHYFRSRIEAGLYLLGGILTALAIVGVLIIAFVGVERSGEWIPVIGIPGAIGSLAIKWLPLKAVPANVGFIDLFRSAWDEVHG